MKKLLNRGVSDNYLIFKSSIFYFIFKSTIISSSIINSFIISSIKHLQTKIKSLTGINIRIIEIAYFYLKIRAN